MASLRTSARAARRALGRRSADALRTCGCCASCCASLTPACRSPCCRPACCSRRTPPTSSSGATRSSSRSTAAASVHDAIRRVPRAFDRLAEGIAALARAAAGYPGQRAAACCSAATSATCRTSSTPRTRSASTASRSCPSTSRRRRSIDPAVGGAAGRRGRPRSPPRRAEFAHAGRGHHRSAMPPTSASGFISEESGQAAPAAALLRRAQWPGRLPDTVCNAPWVSTVVEADGDVRPCFFHAPLGNIHQQPLERDPERAGVGRLSAQPGRARPTRSASACVCTLSLGRRTPA